MPSLLPACCVLCGAAIGTTQRYWMNNFRAVYVNKLNPSLEAQLSGIGIRDGDNYMAPLDRNAAYYFDDFTPDSLRPFSLLANEFGRNHHVPRGHDGIPMHAACWEVLERVAESYGDGEPVNLTALRSFLLCFPLQADRVNWGHDYGWVPYHDHPRDSSGWDIRGLEKIYATDPPYEYRVPNEARSVLFEPTETLSIQAALRSPNLSRAARCLPSPPAAGNGNRSFTQVDDDDDDHDDKFGSFPAEVRDMVLFQLPNADVVSLKLASRSIAETDLGEAFWASRFRPGQRMAHVWEAHDPRVRLGSWRDTYFECLKLHRSLLEMRNRRRVWNISAVLVEALRDVADSPGYSSASSSSSSALRLIPRGSECGVPLPNRMFDQWSTSADILQSDLSLDMEIFDRGCRADPSRVRYVRGISRACRIWVSFISVPGGRFMTGLRFQNRPGEECISIGYIHAREEVVLPVIDGTDGEEQGDLTGLEFAVGSQGMLGVRRLGTSGEKGPWAGMYDGVPKKLLRLKGTGPFMMTCGFDAIKLLIIWSSQRASTITSPGPPPSSPLPYFPSSSSSTSQNIREHSTWHPELPPPHLAISHMLPHKSVTTSQHLHHSFLVNETLLFGGENGEDLSRLKTVKIWAKGDGALVGIGFAYHDDNNADGNVLGRPGGVLPSSREVRPGDGDVARGGLPEKLKCHEFEVHGPAGERIIRLDFGRWGPSGRTRGTFPPKIHTNFGRSFEPVRWPGSVQDIRSIDAGEEGSIVGLYTCMDEDGTFLGLGAFSVPDSLAARKPVEKHPEIVCTEADDGENHNEVESSSGPETVDASLLEDVTGLENVLGELSI